MTHDVRVAVFGNSYAAKIQLPALRAVGGNRVVGIAGHDLAKARATAEQWEIPRASSDYRELLEDDPDLVIVSTPVDLHAPMVRAALETRAAILCEKPFAMNVAEAEELCAAARGRLALIDHQLRFGPERMMLGDMFRGGFLGELWHARLEALWGSPQSLARPHSWWFEAERGGGILGAGASHLIDAVRDHLGEVESVCANLTIHTGQRQDSAGRSRPVSADEHAELWLRLASGVSVSLETSIVLPGDKSFRCEYWGSQARLVLENEKCLSGARHGEDPEPIKFKSPAPLAPELEAFGPFARCEPLFLKRVIAAVAAGATTLEGAATFSDGLACQRVLDAARESARKASWIDCSPR